MRASEQSDNSGGQDLRADNQKAPSEHCASRFRTFTCELWHGHAGPHSAVNGGVEWEPVGRTVSPTDGRATVMDNITKQAIAYMHSSMGMPETSIDQEQNWILGHLVTFAARVVQAGKANGRRCACGHSIIDHV